MADCDSWYSPIRHPIECGAKEVVNSTVSSAGDSFIEKLVKDITGGIADLMTNLMAAWMHTPTESLDSGSAVGGAIATTQGYLTTLTAFFGILGILIACARMAWNARGEDLKEVIRMLVTLIFVQGAAVASITMLLKAGDEFSIWLVDKGTGADMQTNLTFLLPVLAIRGPGFTPTPTQIAVGALLIIVILALIASALQFVFLMLRDVLLAIILVFLPTMAGASLFKSGSQAFEKAIGWIVAMLLYKPVAAGIYVLGVLMIKGQVGDDGKVQASLGSLVLGIMTLILAVLALPALIKFVAPAAGRGVSSAFSGAAGAAIGAGVVATGAALVALAPTGGASAGAVGAGGTGAASTGAAGAAGASGASASPVAASSAAETTSAPSGGRVTGSTGDTGGTDGPSKASSDTESGSDSGSGADRVSPSGPSSSPGETSDRSGADPAPTGGDNPSPTGSNGSGSAPTADGASPAPTGGSHVARTVSEMGQGAEDSGDGTGATIEDMS